MRRFALLLVFVLVMALAAPALAAPMPSPPTDAPVVGERINILGHTPATYPANTAFHIWDAIAASHIADLVEMQDVLTDPAIYAELEVDGLPVAFTEWFNVWDVAATCAHPAHERNLERITRAERFLRSADRWGCSAQGIWLKGYYRNYKKGLPAGPHDFRVTFYMDGGPHVFNHTVTFTP
ncbi:MAG: hypothetical protein ABFS21_06980 [Actinomycetota bacterium]